MKNILVTGGAGFIGSNLCNELSKNLQNKVYSLDNYFTGSEENHVENVKYIRGNTIDIEDLIDIDIDIVFHLGEYSRVEQSFNDIEKLYKKLFIDKEGNELKKNEYSNQISKENPSYINVLKIINNYFNN